MDKALYVAMTGARASLQAQGTVSHNLAKDVYKRQVHGSVSVGVGRISGC